MTSPLPNNSWFSKEQLKGKTVLDIGGYIGDMAEKALKEGAASATVVDNKEYLQYQWGEPEPKEGVNYVTCDFMDYFVPADFVIFSNVIYHLQHPISGLEKVRSLTKVEMLFRTSFVTKDSDGLGWFWYPDGSGHENKTVWCRPTIEGIEKAFKICGFKQCVQTDICGDHVVYRCK